MNSSGNDTSFPAFMRKYQDMVFTTSARIVNNDAEAEDIAQEVFLKAYVHYDNLGDNPSAPGWLRTVTTNLSINHLQRYRKRWRFFSELIRSKNKDDDGETYPVEWTAPDVFHDSLDQNEQRDWIEKALSRLPDHQRVPLVLFHFENMSYGEIATKLQVSLSKIKTDIMRARMALARVLASGPEARSPGFPAKTICPTP